ncbi:5257_t:CDS:1, partial [Ambispora leptoticha]
MSDEFEKIIAAKDLNVDVLKIVTSNVTNVLNDFYHLTHSNHSQDQKINSIVNEIKEQGVKFRDVTAQSLVD